MFKIIMILDQIVDLTLTKHAKKIARNENREKHKIGTL